LTPRFSAARAVREYTKQHYLPAAAAYRELAADRGAVGRQVADWEHAVEKERPALRFGELKVETGSDPVWREMTRVRQPAGAAHVHRNVALTRFRQSVDSV
jgi:hypothetical protein